MQSTNGICLNFDIRSIVHSLHHTRVKGERKRRLESDIIGYGAMTLLKRRPLPAFQGTDLTEYTPRIKNHPTTFYKTPRVDTVLSSEPPAGNSVIVAYFLADSFRHL
jgi:hypothetical protein